MGGVDGLGESWATSWREPSRDDTAPPRSSPEQDRKASDAAAQDRANALFVEAPALPGVIGVGARLALAGAKPNTRAPTPGAPPRPEVGSMSLEQLQREKANIESTLAIFRDGVRPPADLMSRLDDVNRALATRNERGASERLANDVAARKRALYAELRDLGDGSGCREGDTLESLTARRDALRADAVSRASRTDPEGALHMGAYGCVGTSQQVDSCVQRHEFHELTHEIENIKAGPIAAVTNLGAHAVGVSQDMRRKMMETASTADNVIATFAGAHDAVKEREPFLVTHAADREPARAVAAPIHGPPPEGQRPVAPAPTPSHAAVAYPTSPGESLPCAPPAPPPSFATFSASVQGAQGVAPAAPRLPVREMNPMFWGEHVPGNTVWPGSAVTYLDATARQSHRLEVRDGVLYDASGARFDTGSASTLHSGRGRAIFVMDGDGTLYASNYQAAGRFHHSSFLAGGPVAAAGELVVDNGRLVLVSDRSGHYMPTQADVGRFIEVLRSRGVNVDVVEMDSWTNDTKGGAQ